MKFEAIAEARQKRSSVLGPSLDAQSALLPQALGVFAVSLPIFVWAGSFARDAALMAASFAIFAINWGVFYTIFNWLKGPQAADLARRARLQIGGALLWAGAVAQIAAFAQGAGPARESILLAACAGAVLCLVFTAPCLPALLIVAPAAMAGPLLAALLGPGGRAEAGLMWGAFALAFLLALVFNHSLRRQFALAADRQALMAAGDAARRESEGLARSKSDLLATLSQEVRDGLTGVVHVLGAAAGHTARAAPSREQLANALTAAEDLIVVLDTTLDSEMAQAGRLVVNSAPFDLVGVLRDVAARHRPLAARRGLTFTLFIDPELESRRSGATVGDPARVRQILAALIGNAIKHTLRGQVEVRVERHDETHLAIAVADTGPGLAADELEAAFEPFRRIARTAAGVPGAGLGLSLSRQLAALMGARITTRSAVGVGSCFTLELPFDAKASLPVDGDGAAASAASSDRSLKVLIADHDVLSATVLRTILEQLGHQVAQARNGRRAVDLARACGFDLIMLATRMPEMGGCEAAEAIRAGGGALAATPLVGVIDGEGDESQACIAAGIDHVIRKPLTIAAVARAVASAGERSVSPETRAGAARLKLAQA